MLRYKKPTKLFNKNFVLLWQGQFVSLIGNSAFNIALMFWLKHQTNSASLMGLISMAAMIPSVILGPVAGVLADRYSRWKIVVFSDLLRGILVVGFAFLIFTHPVANSMTITSLFIVAIFIGIVGSLFNPAVQASIPDLVPPEKLSGANSLFMLTNQLTNTLGQGVGGVLFRILGAPVLFLIDGVSYIFSAISEFFISIPQDFSRNNNNGNSFIRNLIIDFKEGFKFILHNRGMFILFIQLSLVMFCVAPLMVLFPFYVEDYLKATPDWFGFLMAAGGVGSVFGYAIGSIKTTGRKKVLIFITAFLLLIILNGILGLTTNKIIALFINGVCGVFLGYVNVTIMTLIQLATPSHIRGRVLSVLTTLNIGLMPVGMGLVGIIFDLINKNIPLMFLLCTGICLVITLAFIFSKKYREFIAFEPPKENINNPDNREEK